MNQERRVIHGFEAKWTSLSCKDIERIVAELERKLKDAVGRLDLHPGRAFIIARDAECRLVRRV